MLPVAEAGADELKSIIKADRQIGRDVVAKARTYAEQVDVRVDVRGRDLMQAGAAVIGEAVKLQLILDRIHMEKLGETHRRRGDLRGNQEAVVAVRLALLVTAHGIVSAQAQFLARQKIGG